MSQLNESEIIPIEETEICRILSIHKFSIINLVDMEYFKRGGDFCVLGEPLFGGTVQLATKPLKGNHARAINGKKEKGISITMVIRKA